MNLEIVINIKLNIVYRNKAFSLKITSFENGKKAIIRRENRIPCFTILVSISTGDVNLKMS
jgi:hypothetical protein